MRKSPMSTNAQTKKISPGLYQSRGNQCNVMLSNLPGCSIFFTDSVISLSNETSVNLVKMSSVFVNFFLLILFFPCQISSNSRERCLNDDFFDLVVSLQTDNVHRCNGVILNSNTVITTALCVTDHLFRIPNGCDCRKEIYVIYNLRMASLMGLYCAKHVKVLKTLVHKQFHREAKWANYDIAVLRTRTRMELDQRFVLPFLPKEVLTAEVCEEQAVVAGFWMDGNQKEPNGKMACLNVTIQPFRNCEKVVGASFGNSTLACSHDKTVQVAGVCKGYYGAPLLCKEPRNDWIRLRGFLSHRYGLHDECGSHTPLFYTRADSVAPFLWEPEKFV